MEKHLTYATFLLLVKKDEVEKKTKELCDIFKQNANSKINDLLLTVSKLSVILIFFDVLITIS